MTERVWRLTKERYALDDPLSGEGARRYPGRWHLRGTPLLYTATSLSLAALEAFVHLPAGRYLPSDLTAVELDVAGVSVERVEEDALPEGWAAALPARATQELGTRWAAERRTCGLGVPSAVIPAERNLLLNPAHPDFRAVRLVGTRPFRFDPRMVK